MMVDKELLEAIGQMMDEKFDQKYNPSLIGWTSWRNPMRKPVME